MVDGICCAAVCGKGRVGSCGMSEGGGNGYGAGEEVQGRKDDF